METQHKVEQVSLCDADIKEWQFFVRNIRYNWVDKSICTFQNLEKVIPSAWNTANTVKTSVWFVCCVDAVEIWFHKHVFKKLTFLFVKALCVPFNTQYIRGPEVQAWESKQHSTGPVYGYAENLLFIFSDAIMQLFHYGKTWVLWACNKVDWFAIFIWKR